MSPVSSGVISFSSLRVCHRASVKKGVRLVMWERNLLPKYSPIICSAAKILQMLQELSNSSMIYTAPTQPLALDKNNLYGKVFLSSMSCRTCVFPWFVFVGSFKHVTGLFFLLTFLFMLCTELQHYVRISKISWTGF